jgi:hypothetical protein
MLKIIAGFRFIFIIIFFLTLAPNGHTSTSTKNQLINESSILKIKVSNGIEGWSVIKKENENSAEKNTLGLKNGNEIESWDIQENGQTNLNGFLWIINLQNGPFPTKEKAKQAGIELIKMLRNILTLLPKDIPFRHKLKPSYKNSSSQTKLSWMINFRLGGYKSQYKAEQIAQKVKVAQNFSANIFISREPIDNKNFKSEKNTQSQVAGEFFLIRNTEPAKHETKQFVLIVTSGSSLNVRKQPSTSSLKIGSLQNGAKIPHIKNETDKIIDGSWFHVEYSKGNFGWVSSKYSKIITGTLTGTRNIISQQKTLKTISSNKALINEALKINNLRALKAETTRIPTEPDKNEVEYSEPKVKKAIINQELKIARETNFMKITELQKSNKNLRLDNKKKSIRIIDLKMANTVLRMKEEFKTKSLLELKAELSLIKTELENSKLDYSKLKADKLASTQDLKALGRKNPQKPEGHQKTSKTLKSAVDIDPENIIRTRLKSWIKAWQSRNIPLYLSFYSNNFKDHKRSRQKWEAHRRQSLNSLSNISIKIRDIKTQIPNKTIIKVTFVQQFKSDTILDVGMKELVWAKENSNWKIIKETWKPT